MCLSKPENVSVWVSICCVWLFVRVNHRAPNKYAMKIDYKAREKKAKSFLLFTRLPSDFYIAPLSHWPHSSILFYTRIAGGQGDAVRSGEARHLRQVAQQRHLNELQTVAGHEGARRPGEKIHNCREGG